jgi:hypothetical protein
MLIEKRGMIYDAGPSKKPKIPGKNETQEKGTLEVCSRAPRIRETP